MLDFLRTGGLLVMGLITICALLFVGSLSPLIGIIFQMIGMMAAFEAIEKAADISPSIILGGLKISMFAPMYGLIVLFFSAILWFILKWKVERMQN
jgi:biopolymer transport protein ExbB/TolQ